MGRVCTIPVERFGFCSGHRAKLKQVSETAERAVQATPNRAAHKRHDRLHNAEELKSRRVNFWPKKSLTVAVIRARECSC